MHNAPAYLIQFVFDPASPVADWPGLEGRPALTWHKEGQVAVRGTGTPDCVRLSADRLTVVLGSVPDPSPSPQNGDDAYCAELARAFAADGVDALVGAQHHGAALIRGDAILVARDFPGTTPINYARTPGGWAISSHCELLLALLGADAEPDPEVFEAFRASAWVPRGRSLFRGIETVAPGTCLRFTAGGVEPVGRFTWGAEPGAASLATLDAAADRLDEIFGRCIARSAGAATRVGVALSGGIDSSYLLARACDVLGSRRIRAYTFGFGEDDSQVIAARQVATHLGVELAVTFVEPEDLPELLHQIVDIVEAPLGRDHFPGILKGFGSASGQIEVLLEGFGADPLFGGIYGYRKIVAKDATRICRTDPVVHEIVERPDLPACDTASSSESVSPVRDLMGKYIGAINGHIALKARLYHAACGARMALPYFDRELVEYAEALPDRFKVGEAGDKLAMRHAAARYLPLALANRPKGVTRLRHDAALWSVIVELAERLLRESPWCAGLFFTEGSVAPVLRASKNPDRTTSDLYRLWYIVSTHLWSRRFLRR